MNRFTWIFDIGLRRMKDDLPPGWAFPMGMFLLLGMLMLALSWLGIPFWLVLPVFSLLDLLLTIYLLRINVRRILKLSPWGFTRPRFWIELGALQLTLGFSVAIFAITGGLPGVELPAVAWRFMMTASEVLLTTFCCTAIAGFGVGIIGGYRVRGRSLEMNNFFLHCCLSKYALDWLLPIINMPALLTVIGVISAICLIAAAILKIREFLSPSPSSKSFGGPDDEPFQSQFNI